MRNVVFERIQNFGFSSATIKVVQRMEKVAWCREGAVYGVDISTTNSGAPYADSFVLHEHYR